MPSTTTGDVRKAMKGFPLRPSQKAHLDKLISLKYLAYMASIGATDLHPKGRAATSCLTSGLGLCEGQRILEIGCGTARTLTVIASTCQVRIEGVDLLPEMLRVAHRRVKLAGVQNRVRLVRARSDALPFRDRIYDRVFCESALGFLPSTAAQGMLSEIRRVLKPKGLFVANESIWKHGVPQELVSTIYADSLEDFGLCQASEKAWSADDWLRLMTDVGFEVVSSTVLRTVEENTGPFPNLASSRLAGEACSCTAEPPAGRIILSDLLTLWYRARGWFIPSLIKQRFVFRRLLEKHHGDGKYVEPCLFVLRRPAMEEMP